MSQKVRKNGRIISSSAATGCDNHIKTKIFVGRNKRLQRFLVSLLVNKGGIPTEIAKKLGV